MKAVTAMTKIALARSNDAALFVLFVTAGVGAVDVGVAPFEVGGVGGVGTTGVDAFVVVGCPGFVGGVGGAGVGGKVLPGASEGVGFGTGVGYGVYEAYT